MSGINLRRLVSKKEVASIIGDFAALSGAPIALLDAGCNPIWGAVEEDCPRRYPVTFNDEVVGWVAGDEKASLLVSLISFAALKDAEEMALSSETLHRYRELISLYDFSEKITTSIITEEIARAAIEQALKSLHATGACILVGGGTPDALRIAAAHGDERRYQQLLPGITGIAVEVMKTGTAEIVNDLLSDPRFTDGGSIAHAMLCAPLVCKGRSLGIFAVDSHEPYVYRAEDLRLLKSIAAQTAIALANAQFCEQLQAYSEALEKRNAQLEEEIVRRSRSEKSLRESEEKYRLHFDNASDVIYSLDRNFCITNVSPSVQQVMGYAPEELVGRPFYELNILTEESLARALSDTERLFNGESVLHAEYEMVGKDGLHKIAEIQSKGLYHQGRVETIFSVARDITERRLAERALEASELEFRTMAESLTNGLIIMKEGKITYVNDRACAICGYPREELMNIWGPDLVLEEESKNTEEMLAKVRASGVWPEQFDTWIRRKDGTQCCLNLRFSFSYKEQQQYAGYVVLTDITDRKLAEDQLQATTRFIDRVIESSLDAIIVTDTQGYVKRINRYFLDLLGYTQEEVLGKHMSCFSPFKAGTYDAVYGAAVVLDESYLSRQREMFLQLSENTRVVNWEIYLAHKNGRLIPSELNISFLYSDAGTATAAVGILRNVEERHKSRDELKEMLAFLDNVIESSLDGIVVSDTRGFLTRVNRSFCAMTGYSREEMQGKRMPDVSVVTEGTYESTAGERIEIGSQHIEYMLSMVAKFIEEGRITGWESYLVRKDGKVIPVDVNIVYFYDKEGKRLGTVGIVRDNTEHRRAEQVITETKDFLDNIIESSLDPIIIADDTGVVSRVNRSFQQLMGMTPTELVGKHIAEFVPPQPGRYESASGEMVEIDESFYRTSYESMTDLVEQGSIYGWESCYFSKKGKIIPVEQTIFYLYNKQGERMAVIGISRDITERKRSERQILNARNFLENVFKTSADGIVVTDASNSVTMLNKAAEMILGYTRDEILGRKMEDFIPKGGEIEKQGRKMQQELLSRGALYQKEHRWIRKNGTVADIEMSIGLLKDSSGSAEGSVLCIRDIGERKAAEQKLIEYQDQLRCLTSQLTLSEEQERRRIAGDLHDRIAQSLALSKIKLGALGASLSSPDMVKDLADIRSLLDQSIQDTRSVISDLCPPFLYELGLEKALEWLLEDIQRQYGIRTQLEQDATASQRYDDDVRILVYQSVRELIINVVKHAQAKTAHVALHRDEHNLQITVEDDGKGFLIGPHGLRVGREGGFGLFRIKERFEHLGGFFSVESKLRHGTKVCLRIPLQNDGH